MIHDQQIVITMLALASLFVTGCDEPYMEQPLAGDLDSTLTGINATQIATIQQRSGTGQARFSFAVTSDPHVHYTELRSTLDHITTDTAIHFILVCGDITDGGDLKEMKRYVEEMERPGIPFVTIMGNREHIGLGRITFEEMFGGRNSQFVAGGVRFVLFDNVVKESDLPVDFDWLRTTLAAPYEGPTIIAMHIQPTDGSQLSPGHLEELNNIMAEHRPDHVFMGHNHYYREGEFPDGTPYTTVSWPKVGEYVKVRVEDGDVTTELVRTVPPAAGDEGR